MATVAYSTSRSGQHEDLQPFERLAVTLSSSFSSLQYDEVEACVGECGAQLCGRLIDPAATGEGGGTGAPTHEGSTRTCADGGEGSSSAGDAAANHENVESPHMRERRNGSRKWIVEMARAKRGVFALDRPVQPR